MVLPKFINDPIDDLLIEVVSAEMRVAVRRFHFDDAFANFQNRDVERAAAKVVHGDRFVLFLIQAVGESGGRRLIDDSQNFKTCDSPGILRRLALRIIKVGRNCNNCFLDLLA